MLERNTKYLGCFLKRSSFILVLLVFLPFSTVAKMPEGATPVTVSHLSATWEPGTRLHGLIIVLNVD